MILGIDPGTRRVGLAVADTETRFARPLEVIDSREIDPLERIVEVVRSMEVELVVVGRPIALSGRPERAVEDLKPFVEALRESLSVEVREFDERLSTVVAEAGLRASGAGRKARAALKDAVAAQVMLQNYLDTER
ncbi:MAG: putative pre6S rRNA nuclease [Actinomycetota bacterium]|jgi:putative Holliday junction resolvase|nr:putative pre6S rRNA nuclease [Actinomycetota bacterium]